MTISEKVFETIKDRGMSQKELSRLTGIAESSISDWKRKKTNPSSENLLKICNALGMKPDELLSGTVSESTKSRNMDYYIVSPDSTEGFLLEAYQKMSARDRGRLEGYLHMLLEQAGEE